MVLKKIKLRYFQDPILSIHLFYLDFTKNTVMNQSTTKKANKRCMMKKIRWNKVCCLGLLLEGVNEANDGNEDRELELENEDDNVLSFTGDVASISASICDCLDGINPCLL